MFLHAALTEGCFDWYITYGKRIIEAWVLTTFPHDMVILNRNFFALNYSLFHTWRFNIVIIVSLLVWRLIRPHSSAFHCPSFYMTEPFSDHCNYSIDVIDNCVGYTDLKKRSEELVSIAWRWVRFPMVILARLHDLIWMTDTNEEIFKCAYSSKIGNLCMRYTRLEHDRASRGISINGNTIFQWTWPMTSYYSVITLMAIAC